MTIFQSFNKSIGEGVEDHFGPIRRKIFVVRSAVDSETLEVLDDPSLALEIQTHHYPYGGTDRDAQPADRLFHNLEAFLSFDEAIAHRAALQVLNRNLAVALSYESGSLEREYQHVRKISSQDGLRTHPMTLFVVAQEFALRGHQQELESFADIRQSASKIKDQDVRDELIRSCNILSLPNTNVTITQMRGCGSDILISGDGLSLTVEKLLVRGTIARSDLEYLAADLLGWIKQNPVYAASDSARSILKVMEAFSCCERLGTREFEARQLHRLRLTQNAGAQP